MIVVDHLTKRYGEHYAIEDLTFTVETGKIYGFLGPNGAGKSTTMNIITGCLAATSGSVQIDGFDILENPIEAKKKIGYLPEIPPVYTDRTVREYLKFVAELKKVPKAQIKSEVDRVISAVEIGHYEHRLIGKLSKGYRQRVGIAEALLGDPELIILDEPTVGLDPQQIIEIRELIASLRENHTVILSSHILPEVQAVCDMILVINHGHMIALDTPDNLEKAFAPHAEMQALLEGGREKIEALLSENFEDAEYTLDEEDGAVAVTFSAEKVEPRDLARKLFYAAAKADTPILRMSARKASLEDIFIEMTKDEVPVSDGNAPENEASGETDDKAAPAEEIQPAEEASPEEKREGGEV